ncbi:CHAT domain-containing protein [Rhizobium ruizarguesonis]|uniref:CHAT domain-containing protein n=1 Tax=Rhizobium ruizarguesonis TaxID=2081791 RepID=UPI001639D29A|nr:CHAT domain-containing protein [Rhizobium ruizarguesonis]MBC2807030.1 CHAT domain-containing protein [Rhizobium ruizarguesonis]
MDAAHTISSKNPETADPPQVYNDLRPIFVNREALAGGDVICFGDDSLALRLYLYIDGLLSCMTSDGEYAFSRFFVLVPAISCDKAGGKTALNRAIAAAITRYPERALDPAETEIVELYSHDSATLIESISERQPYSATIVLNGALYRSPNVRSVVPADIGATSSLQENFWVPEIAYLASGLRNGLNGYFLLDVGHFAPVQPALREILHDIDDRVDVYLATDEDDLQSELSVRALQWSTLAREGRLGAALQEIEALPSKYDDEKPSLKIQLMHLAGLTGQTLREIEQLALDEKSNPQVVLSIAKIAEEAGADALSLQLLRLCAPKLTTMENIQTALRTAKALDAEDLEHALETRLRQHHPNAAVLADRALAEHKSAGRFAEASVLLASINAPVELIALYGSFAQELSSPVPPDYSSVRRRLTNDYPQSSEAIEQTLVRDALRRGLILHAFELIMALNDPLPSRWKAFLTVEVIEQILLQSRGNIGTLVDPKRLTSAIEISLRYAATHPVEGRLRLKIARLLDLQVAGKGGIALIASIIMSSYAGQIEFQREDDVEALSPKEFEEFQKFHRDAFAWLEKEAPVTLGKTRFPSELLPCAADRLVATFKAMLPNLLEDAETEDDLVEFRAWLTVGVSIAISESLSPADLELMSVGAIQLSRKGKVQEARDYAEHALLCSGSNPTRQRIAWGLFGDVYRRSGNAIEALIAFACASKLGGLVPLHQLWIEMYGLAGLLRDVGLINAAEHMLEPARAVLNELGLAEGNDIQLDLLALQLKLKRGFHDTNDFRASLPVLLQQAVDLGRRAAASGGDHAPVTLTLGQIMAWTRDAEILVNPEDEELFESLVARLNGPIEHLTRAAASLRPSVTQIFAVHKSTELSRYSEDSGFDSDKLAPLLRKLLGHEADASAISGVALSLELLSDRALPKPGWQATSEPIPPLKGPDEALTMLEKYSVEASFVMIGIDSRDRLVRLDAAGGTASAPIVEPADTFSVSDYRQWTKEFPYRYGVDDETANLFYTSTEKLGLTPPLADKVVFVADSRLQQLAFNLLWVDDDFAGRNRAIASAPSLSWLDIARAQPLQTSGNRKAWISADLDQEGTLTSIARWLQPTFEASNISLNTAATLPGDLAGSQLVVVAAHGRVSNGEQFFHQVSDEGNLRILASDLADALRNVGVVVLFVCSGGRSDKHPAANMTIGLTRQLLDRGCSTVVASPWPLASAITPRWFPTFLERWDAGDQVIDAVFKANQDVGKATGYDPARYLALHVFGDPFRKITDG